MSAYVDLLTRYVYKKLLVWSDLDSLAENDQSLYEDGWVATVATVFFQAAAPTGWTKATSVNDKMLRVVAGAGGGTGGSLATATPVTLAHTAHTISTEAAHTHNLNNHQHDLDSFDTYQSAFTGPPGLNYLTGAGNNSMRRVGSGSTSINAIIPTTQTDGGGGTMGSGGSHNHGGSTTGARLTDLALAYIDIIICTKDAPAGTYTDATEVWQAGVDIIYQDLSKLGLNDKYNHDRLTPSASVSIFGNAVAPTGWTQVTSQNDKCLRVVSGTGAGGGGSAGLSAAITLAHTHTITSDAGHVHSNITHQHNLATGVVPFRANSSFGYIGADGSNCLVPRDGSAVSATAYKGRTDALGGGTGNSNTGGVHDHGGTGSALTNVTLAYLDVIQCSKDSAGGSTYTDMSTFFVYKKKLSYQTLTKMAQNDDYLKYHTMNPGAVMFFYQAAQPIGWTKIVTQDDRALRIVSGATGGSAGGSAAISAGLTLAHTHSIPTYSHRHVVPSHLHSLESYTEPNAGAVDYNAIGQSYNNILDPMVVYNYASPNSSGNSRLMKTTKAALADTTDFVHSHGGNTGSLLSNVTLAYADVIMCSKD